MQKKKVHMTAGKFPELAFQPTRWQHNNDPTISLGSPNKLYVTFIYFSSRYLCSHYVANLIEKLELHVMVVSVLLKD